MKMNTRRLFLTFLFLALSLSTAYGDDFPYLLPKDSSFHRSIDGAVFRVAGDMVFFKTEEGTLRKFGLKEVNREGIPSPQPGDEVTLTLDRWNDIIDITEAGDKGGFGGHEVTGTVFSYNGPEKEITLKTEEGEARDFELKDAVTTKLNGIEKGREVTLALDGENRVMDAYRPG
jgi:hypothetical protein